MTKNPPSIPEICQAIWEIETELDLHNWQEHGVYPWRLLRFNVYYYVTEKTATYGKAHPKLDAAKKLHFKLLGTLLWHGLVKTPYFPRKADYIVMPHTRQVNGVDIYTDDLLQQLPKEKTLILYKDWRPAQYEDSRDITGYLLAAGIGYKLRALYQRNDMIALCKPTLTRINTLLEQRLGVTLHLEKLLRDAHFNFVCRLFAYRRVLKKVQPKAIFMVTGYMHEALLCAAKEASIPVYEMQHGTMTPYHLGYSYPSRPKVAYTPQAILTYGAFWTDFTALPAGMTPIIVGSQFMEELRQQPFAKVAKQVLVISQGTIGEALLKIVVEAAAQRPEYHFIYRLHPSEDASSYRVLLQDVKATDNVALSDAPNQTYALMQQSDHVVGVYSTAVVEAIALGCKGIIVTLAGHEYLTPIIERGDAVAVANGAELAQALLEARPCRDPHYYYAPYQLQQYFARNWLTKPSTA